MPRFRSSLVGLCVLMAFCALSALADTPTLEVTVSRNQIYLGESVLMEVKVGGTSNPDTPNVSALRTGAPQLLGSQSSSHYSVIIINGMMRKEGFTGRTFTYKITPDQAGELVTGPITATVDGQTLTATGPTITVTGVTRQDTVAVSVTASRETVLVDEPFEIHVDVKLLRLPGRFADVDPIFPNDPPHLESEFLNAREIDGLKGPDYSQLLNGRLIQRSQPGFTINNYSVQADLFDFSAMMGQQGSPARFKLDRQLVRENGKEYWNYSLAIPFSPVAEGSYTFGPVLFKGNVPASVNSNGDAVGNSIFAVGPAAIVRVIPPPEQNRPDSYTGAIGSNLVAEATLDTQTCNVGDPLKLALTLSGAIQMRNVTPPKLSLQSSLLDHFEIYDDTVQTTKQDTRRCYTYTLRPRHPGSLELPPLEVAFYDVTTREYRTVRTLPIPLKVRQAVEITAAQVIGGSTNQAIHLHREADEAMRPAGMRWTAAGAEQAPLWGSLSRLITIGLMGPILFILILAWNQMRLHRPAFRATQRRRHAYSRAQSGFTHDKAPDPCGILRHYLADRFDIRTDSMTPAEAQAVLLARGIPAPLAQQFADQMQRVFDAAFETARSSTPIDSVALLSILAAIEAHLDSPHRKPADKGPLVLLLLLTAVSAHASTPAERAFIWDEAVTEMSSAQTPGEFLVAAGSFQKLVDLGVRNPTLFYNQGTALLLADKPAEAIEVLLRAERHGGSAPDIQRNLAIADARKAGLKTPVLSWLRLVLFWHYNLDGAHRATIAAAAFSGLWLAWAATLIGLRRTGRILRITCFICLATFGSSVLSTLQQESRAHRPASFDIPGSSVGL